METIEKIRKIAERILDKVFQFLTGKSLWKYGFLFIALLYGWSIEHNQIVLSRSICSSNFSPDVAISAFMVGTVIGIWIVLLIFEMFGNIYKSTGSKRGNDEI